MGCNLGHGVEPVATFEDRKVCWSIVKQLADAGKEQEADSLQRTLRTLERMVAIGEQFLPKL